MNTPARNRQVVIVGGVAGGASTAARLRRLDETTEITIFERGPHVSFANCGLPYHIGKVIKERAALLLHTPESLEARFGISVRVNHEVVAIDRQAKSVRVLDRTQGIESDHPYDVLVLSPGAKAFIPPVPGTDGPTVFTLKTIPDMDAIQQFIAKNGPRHATVIGGGYIGIEAAENLKERGIDVTIVEMADQLMTPVDFDMAQYLHQHVELHGVELHLAAQLERIEEKGTKTTIHAAGLAPFETELVIMAVGVRPESELAKAAGLEIGPRGGIVVDDQMRTSDEAIYAVGDAVQVTDPITKQPVQIPLASPANRQGRIAADNICGRSVSYRGTMGTAICKVFDLAVAMVGQTEKALQRLDIPHQSVTVHPMSHAPYYPGACRLTLKIVYSPTDGTVLGAQAIGADGADKRIDVIATAIAGGMTVYDLEHLELCYAPPFGAAKDPVNQAAFVAANILRGEHLAITAKELDELDDETSAIIDVRRKEELLAGEFPSAIHIPLDELRARVDELPRNKDLITVCQVGHRGYIAQRFLTQRGFDCRNLIGGYRSYAPFLERPISCSDACCSSPRTKAPRQASPGETSEAIVLDACGLQCPGPLMKMQAAIQDLAEGSLLRVEASDPGFPADARAWAANSGHTVLETGSDKGTFFSVICKGGASQPAPRVDTAVTAPGGKKLTMVVFSNDLDKAMASMIIANGAAAMGMEASLFFTFWGLNILRKDHAPPVDKTLIERAFGFMMPQGADKLTLSKMHMAGMGTAMMKSVMANKNVNSLPTLIESAQQAGVRFIACTMTMDVMGIKPEELIDGVEAGGVAAYLASAGDSAINLFV